MTERYIPINKGNYSMDTDEREGLFESHRGEGWEADYAEYRRNWSDYPKRQHVAEYPLLVDIELASVCNLHCPMCYTITDEFKKKVNTTLMTWKLYTKIIDEIGGKVPAIRLSLRGEAFLHSKFVDCIRYAKEKGIPEVSTLTNGSRLTPSFSKEIIDAGIDWITISVDGIGETYEKIRKPIKFAELVEKIKNIKRIKERRGLHRPVIKVQGIWPAIKEDLEGYYETFKPITDLIAFNPLIDYLSNDEDIDYLNNFTCPQQYQRIVIGADGLVMKCSNDEENSEIVGDITSETVHQVWHGSKMQAERARHKQQDGFMQSSVCRKCYLPRQTKDEKAVVEGRSFIVKNYINRSQVIGR
ncbi:MAG: radical SAM/SPASM domain-containing protein [Candidatus Electrothrix communis]|nr:MAG: radical SAM/SPASM domain-containing protein [Candidatus Electrothrix communis]